MSSIFDLNFFKKLIADSGSVGNCGSLHSRAFPWEVAIWPLQKKQFVMEMAQKKSNRVVNFKGVFLIFPYRFSIPDHLQMIF